MRFNTFTNLQFELWKSCVENNKPHTTVCLLGSPGIGKTSTAYVLRDRMTEYVCSRNKGAEPAICEVLDLSSMLPEDLLGLPWRDGKVTSYCPPGWLAALCQEGAYGVLVLDDLPAAAPALQVAARQVALERRVHSHRLADGVAVVVTGNRRQDKSASRTLPSHFLNSVMLLEVGLDVKEWSEWYAAQPESLDPVIPAYLHWQRSQLSQLPKDSDKHGAFATPRSWHKLARCLDTAFATNTVLEVASGFVGEGPAVGLKAFIDVRSQLVDPALVLLDPKRHLPNPKEMLNSPDRAISMACSLGELAANWEKHHEDPAVREKAPLYMMRAIAWATEGDREYVGAGVNTYSANGGSQSRLVAAATKHKNDPLVRSLLSHLQAVLMS